MLTLEFTAWDPDRLFERVREVVLAESSREAIVATRPLTFSRWRVLWPSGAAYRP